MWISPRASFLSEDSIKVGKEEAGTNNFNQEYDKLQANQDTILARQLL